MRKQSFSWLLLILLLLLGVWVRQERESLFRANAQQESVVEANTQVSVLLLNTSAVVVARNGGQATITAIARDAVGQPVTDAIIHFSSTIGAITPNSATTDSNGIATTTFTSDGTPGQALITATHSNISQTALLEIRDSQSTVLSSTLQLVLDTNELLAGQQTQVNVALSNAAGQPIHGELVTFFGSLGEIATASAITDSQGKAKTVFTAGQTAGIARITVMAGAATNSSILMIKSTISTPVATQNSLFLPLIER